MTVLAILKRLRQDGWIVVRQAGSHRQLHHPSKLLHPKVARSIIGQARLEDD